MKLSMRILALSVVVAGLTAAATTHKTASTFVSHQSASALLPTPGANPGMLPPDCGPGGFCEAAPSASK